MRKISIAIIISVISAGLAFAQGQAKVPAGTEQTQEEKNLEILSKKLVRMKKEMDKFVKDMSAAYSEDRQPASMEGFGSNVKVDITENDDAFTVTADLPGMDKDKIDVTLEGSRVLKISGMRHMEKRETSPGGVIRQERMEGRFERVLDLPAECKSEGIKASYENGVLEITIPKKAPVKVETVKVKVI